MLLGAIGASAVSQLYQGLTSQKTAASPQNPVQTPGTPPAPDDPASQPGTASPLSAAAAKVVADLKALLLGVQAGDGGSASAAPGATPGANGASPDPASDLVTLMGDLKKAGAHHGRHHAQPPASGSTQTDSTDPAGAAPAASGIAGPSHGINAYAAALKAGGTSIASLSA